jgi:hypothetical protein
MTWDVEPRPPFSDLILGFVLGLVLWLTVLGFLGYGLWSHLCAEHGTSKRASTPRGTPIRIPYCLQDDPRMSGDSRLTWRWGPATPDSWDSSGGPGAGPGTRRIQFISSPC